MFVLMNGFIIYYLLNLLLLENGGVGPRLFCKKIRVMFYDPVSEGTFEWQATWVDYLRRVFMLYEVRYIVPEIGDKKEKVWYSKGTQMSHFWNCPLCMGFWLALGTTTLSIFFKIDILNTFFQTDILNTFFQADILNIIFTLSFIILASAGVGVFLYSFGGD